MGSYYKRKKDLPFPDIQNDDEYVIVTYQEDGRLYLVKNTKKISCSFDDYLVVTFAKNEDDNHLPYAIVKFVGFLNQYSFEIAEFMNFNLFDEEIRYHGEDIILNISNPSGGNKGASVIILGEINKAGGEGKSKETLEQIMQKVIKKPSEEKPEKAVTSIEQIKVGETFIFKRYIRNKK